MATSATNPEDPQQQSPFMKLPPELRLAIYTFALQNIVNEIKAIPLHTFTIPGHSPNHPPMLGALALLHTSRNIRRESSECMRRLAHAHYKQFRAHNKAVFDKFLDTGATGDEAHDEVDAAMGRLEIIGFVDNTVYDIHITACIGWKQLEAKLEREKAEREEAAIDAKELWLMRSCCDEAPQARPVRAFNITAT